MSDEANTTEGARLGAGGALVSGARFTKLAAGEVRRLLKLTHPDPHSILGFHPRAGSAAVRAYRPGALSVVLIGDGGGRTPMRARPEPGLFEAVFAEQHAPRRYRVEAHYPGGRLSLRRDPYCFMPTLTDDELKLWAEQRHEAPDSLLGAHPRTADGVEGVGFALWAPNALGVSVVGDFNGWDGRLDMMRLLGGFGVWELFIPEIGPGVLYKYELRTRGGAVVLKTDPYAEAMERPPGTASIVYRSRWTFDDAAWMEQRAAQPLLKRPLSIYEVHAGSWRRVPEEGNRVLSYRELAVQLADYVLEMGFNYVEFLPLMEHPFSASWGYQVSGYFAPTARFGSPDDFRFLVNHLHRRGIGVILDWVPAHFPTDAFSLGRLDGTALYEHLDPRQGMHPEWGTYIFNFARNEVRSFLLASAHYWLGRCHVDGLRADAVSSMLYLDYGRDAGQWIPNQYGGRENLEAVSLLQQLNREVHGRHPGAATIAEESTAWPAVSRPTYLGGLGFTFKWDMGWMHDTLEYFSKDPVHRRYHHRDLTFGFLYAWSENFILPLSHDEVVHEKRALLAKMPGDRWQQFANLRALFGYMWARPGKKLLFMGGEFGQTSEWSHEGSLAWHLLAEPDHRGLKQLVRDLNRRYLEEPALWEADADPAGFSWVEADNADDNVIAFLRAAPSSGRRLLCVGNFSPVVRQGHRVGVPVAGWYQEILNTDSALYGGSNQGNAGGVTAEPMPWHGRPYSVSLRLPPLAVVWLRVPAH